MPAMKMISVEYPTFRGFVYYTGLARMASDGRDTGDYIEEWLVDGTANMRMFQVVEHLRQAATRHMQSTGYAGEKSGRLTIVVGAFARGVPRAAIISNFENESGQFSTGSIVEFQSSWVGFPKGSDPVLLVTGNKASVSPAERSALIDEVVAAGEDSRRIRVAMESVNQAAANHPAAAGMVSGECVVVSTDASGRGSLEVGDQPGLQLRSIRDGSTRQCRVSLRSWVLVRSANFVPLRSQRAIGLSLGQRTVKR